MAFFIGPATIVSGTVLFDAGKHKAVDYPTRFSKYTCGLNGALRVQRRHSGRQASRILGGIFGWSFVQFGSPGTDADVDERAQNPPRRQRSSCFRGIGSGARNALCETIFSLSES